MREQMWKSGGKGFFVLFAFLGPHPWHMEFPRRGSQIGATAASLHHSTAMQDPSHAYDLQHSSRQHWILNPLSEARDRTCNLMVPSQILSAEPRRAGAPAGRRGGQVLMLTKRPNGSLPFRVVQKLLFTERALLFTF